MMVFDRIVRCRKKKKTLDQAHFRLLENHVFTTLTSRKLLSRWVGHSPQPGPAIRIRWRRQRRRRMTPSIFSLLMWTVKYHLVLAPTLFRLPDQLQRDPYMGQIAKELIMGRREGFPISVRFIQHNSARKSQLQSILPGCGFLLITTLALLIITGYLCQCVCIIRTTP